MIPMNKILFIISFLLYICLCISGNPLRPINFQFYHHETIAISDDDVEEEYSYDEETKDFPSNGTAHVRKRRSAKWSPDYDLYHQWAEEYYAEYEAEALRSKEEKDKPKVDFLEKFNEMGANKTEEELEKERQQKKTLIEKSAMIGTWVIGILFTFCCCYILGKKGLKKFTCDFCDPKGYKSKVTKMVNIYQPGVHVHKNGYREVYTPTEEEMEALKEITKLLHAL